MIEALVPLLDRLISLIREAGSRDRRLYEDFLVDFETNFDRLHSDYLKSFLKYRSLVLDTKESLTFGHSVIPTIENDSIFSEHLRAKIVVLRQFEDDPLFGPLAYAILDYLSTGKKQAPQQLGGSNIVRAATAAGINHIVAGGSADSEKRADALVLIDELVMELQSAYGNVLLHISSTKRTLLDKRLRFLLK